jgi:hypothetical protein
MNARGFSAFVVIAAICSSWFAGRLMSADPPKSKPTQDELGKIQRQIADVSLKLAETDLQVLVDANRKLPNTFPRSAVERLQQVVAVAKQRVAQTGKDEDSHASYLALTEAEMNIADADYRTSLQANKQIKNAVPPLELERLRLTAELAMLRHDRAQHASKVPDILLLGWQLDDLREQVRRLGQQVELYRGNE